MAKQETKSTLGQRVGLLAGLGIVGLAILAAVSYGLWRAFLEIPHGALAGVALGALALLPVALAGGWKLGHLEARGVLAGMGLGINSVVATASDVAEVRLGTVTRIREMQAPQQAPPVAMPRMLDITPTYREHDVIV